MDEQKFVALCKKEVVAYSNDKHPDTPITEDDVRVVWLSKVLQNNKALLVTTARDGRYYEVTFSGNAGSLYIDVYQKVNNYTVVV